MKEVSPIEIAPLLPIVKVRPMLMLTGFLGAGKTTLLRELLEHLGTQSILSDVILNDRENAYLDKATIKDHAADVRALTGSCVCCEGFNDLIDVIMKASESCHDVLMIELNGTADPVPLQEAFTLLESKFYLRPRWQVCVIDPRYFRKRRKFNDLESLQLETASHYYISWSSVLDEKEELEIEKGIKEINARATRTTALQLADALSQAIRKNKGYTLTTSKPQRPLSSSLEFSLTPPQKQDARHQLAHEFTGCQIVIPKPVEPSDIILCLDKLPESVIRAKALVMLNSDTDRLYLYERVGLFTSPKPISAQRKGERPCTGIFIGPDLNPEEILKLTQEYLHPECHFPELIVETQEASNLE